VFDLKLDVMFVLFKTTLGEVSVICQNHFYLFSCACVRIIFFIFYLYGCSSLTPSW